MATDTKAQAHSQSQSQTAEDVIKLITDHEISIRWKRDYDGTLLAVSANAKPSPYWHSKPVSDETKEGKREALLAVVNKCVTGIAPDEV